jgi:hypothetical protein
MAAATPGISPSTHERFDLRHVFLDVPIAV